MCTQADPGQALGLDVGCLVAAAGCVAYAKNSSTRKSIWANRVTRFDWGALGALVVRPFSFLFGVVVVAGLDSVVVLAAGAGSSARRRSHFCWRAKVTKRRLEYLRQNSLRAVGAPFKQLAASQSGRGIYGTSRCS